MARGDGPVDGDQQWVVRNADTIRAGLLVVAGLALGLLVIVVALRPPLRATGDTAKWVAVTPAQTTGAPAAQAKTPATTLVPRGTTPVSGVETSSGLPDDLLLAGLGIAAVLLLAGVFYERLEGLSFPGGSLQFTSAEDVRKLTEAVVEKMRDQIETAAAKASDDPAALTKVLGETLTAAFLAQLQALANQQAPALTQQRRRLRRAIDPSPLQGYPLTGEELSQLVNTSIERATSNE